MPTDSEFWDSLFAKGQKFRPLKEDDLNAILARVGQSHDVADIGAGTGGLVLELAARGIHATAFDISRVALDALLESAAQRELRESVAAVQADINDASFGSGYEASFDIVFMKLAIAFAHDRVDVLGRVRAMLRPGGALVLITPVLIDRETYDERQTRISVPRGELESQLHEQFVSVEVFREEAQDPSWPMVTYICRSSPVG